MTATYTFDVFTTLDGIGWGKQGPELLAHRLSLYDEEQRMVFGATTFRSNMAMLATSALDPWVTRMKNLPATVVSSTLQPPFDWPNATVESGAPVDIVARL